MIGDAVSRSGLQSFESSGIIGPRPSKRLYISRNSVSTSDGVIPQCDRARLAKKQVTRCPLRSVGPKTGGEDT